MTKTEMVNVLRRVGWTQATAAKHMGISYQHFGYMCRGERPVPFHVEEFLRNADIAFAVIFRRHTAVHSNSRSQRVKPR